MAKEKEFLFIYFLLFHFKEGMSWGGSQHISVLSGAGGRAALKKLLHYNLCNIICKLHHLHVHRIDQRFNFVGSKNQQRPYTGEI